MKALGRKRLPWIEPIYIAAYLLIVVVNCLLESDEFTLRAIVESIHGLKPITGFSFVIFVYLLSPLRYWIFLSTFTLILLGMRYFIYELLSDHASSALLWAAWMDTKWLLLIALPVAIIVTILKIVGIFKWSVLDGK